MKPTCELGYKNNRRYLKCLKCGHITVNAENIYNKYCKKCKTYHTTSQEQKTILNPANYKPYNPRG